MIFITHKTQWHREHLKQQVDRKSTRLNSSHGYISYAVFCLKKKKTELHANSWHSAIRRSRSTGGLPRYRPALHLPTSSRQLLPYLRVQTPAGAQTIHWLIS